MFSKEAELAYRGEQEQIERLAKQLGVEVSFWRMWGSGSYFLLCSFNEKGSTTFKKEIVNRNWEKDRKEKVTFPYWQPEKKPYFVLKMRKLVHQD